MESERTNVAPAVVLFVWLIILSNCGTSQTRDEYEGYLEVQASIKQHLSSYSADDPDSNRMLIFEKYFNDSLVIACGKNILYNQKVITIRTLEAAYTAFYWDQCEDYLVILLPDLKQKVNVKADKRFRYIYFNRDKKGKWFIDYSNELRIYK